MEGISSLETQTVQNHIQCIGMHLWLLGVLLNFTRSITTLGKYFAGRFSQFNQTIF